MSTRSFYRQQKLMIPCVEDERLLDGMEGIGNNLINNCHSQPFIQPVVWELANNWDLGQLYS